MLVFDPGTGSNGESMEPEIVSRKNKQDNFHVIERKEIELRNFRCVISGIEGPQKAAGTKKKYTFMYYAPP